VNKQVRSRRSYHSKQCGIVLKPRSDRIEYTMSFALWRMTAAENNKKFELMLTRRAKTYSSYCSQTVGLSPATWHFEPKMYSCALINLYANFGFSTYALSFTIKQLVRDRHTNRKRADEQDPLFCLLRRPYNNEYFTAGKKLTAETHATWCHVSSRWVVTRGYRLHRTIIIIIYYASKAAHHIYTVKKHTQTCNIKFYS